MKAALSFLTGLLLLVLCVGLGFAASEQQVGRLEDPYTYVAAFVDSLAWGHSGLSRIDSRLDRGTVQGATEYMYQVKKAAQDYRMAAKQVDEYKQSTNETIRLSATAAHKGYLGVVEADEQTVGILQGLYSASGNVDPGVTMNRIAEIRAARDASWMLLPWAAVAATHALVQSPSTKDERLNRLSITSREREALIRSIEKWFGPSVKGGVKAGQEAVVGAVALIHEFLSNSGFRSKDSR